MKVHKGTYESDGRPVRWVESARKREFTLNDLIDGLCSRYIRNRTPDDTETLPVCLSKTAIIRTAHEEFDAYGTNATWTWVENNPSDMTSEQARAWAERLVLVVLPGLAIPKEND